VDATGTKKHGRFYFGDTPRAEFAGLAPAGGADAPHNALWDARVAKACHRLLAAAPEAEASAGVSGQTRQKW
jgi:hypothetical protein